ncbi:hypothetical protein ACQKP8_27115, partial [Photobacterium alginatilyticum]|uniref:hypothetical protein n=1 Tax=Photobacterium alginatilyticum TaxID=1775171 RepID=UPI004068ACA0
RRYNFIHQFHPFTPKFEDVPEPENWCLLIVKSMRFSCSYGNLIGGYDGCTSKFAKNETSFFKSK